MRDAANLGWKLDLVLRGRTTDSILDSYQTERQPHVKTWGDLAVLAGRFICETDPDKAAARDAFLRQGGAPPLRPPPILTSGLFNFSSDDPGVAGQLFPQRNIRWGGQVGLFDDLTGYGFLVLTQNDPEPFLTTEDRVFMKRFDMRCMRFSRDAGDASVLVDETGEYESFFNKNRLEAVIVRPDRYVFSGVSQLGELGRILGKLRAMLESG
jgi:hypothetical protein